ncbi:hypothetical protein [Paenimyroides ceti]
MFKNTFILIITSLFVISCQSPFNKKVMDTFSYEEIEVLIKNDTSYKKTLKFISEIKKDCPECITFFSENYKNLSISDFNDFLVKADNTTLEKSSNLIKSNKLSYELFIDYINLSSLKLKINGDLSDIEYYEIKKETIDEFNDMIDKK